MKRPFDILLSALGLVATSPLWLIVSIATRFQGRGGVFYEQERWGRGGTTFTVRKFRTMRVSDGPIRPVEAGDPRVTTVGRVLRAMGLDELPQLLAIFRGEMSFVGPRPLAVGEVVRTETGEMVPYEQVPGFQERLAVRPGLTGPTTIFLPKDTPPHIKFARDVAYIEERTFLGDVRLVILSIWISLRGRWESRGPKV